MRFHFDIFAYTFEEFFCKVPSLKADLKVLCQRMSYTGLFCIVARSGSCGYYGVPWDLVGSCGVTEHLFQSCLRDGDMLSDRAELLSPAAVH